jgi:hypothetical protein
VKEKILKQQGTQFRHYCQVLTLSLTLPRAFIEKLFSKFKENCLPLTRNSRLSMKDILTALLQWKSLQINKKIKELASRMICFTEL